MPRTPKASDGENPNKLTGKPTTDADNGMKVVKAKKSPAKTAKPKAAKHDATAPAVVEAAVIEAAKTKRETKDVVHITSLEERVRLRAYEIYLRRGGQGGSPEQDWFEAMAEVYEESVA